MDSSQTENSSLIQNIVDLDRRLAQRLRRASDGSWLDIDLTLPSLRALLAIDREPGITPSEIADYLGVGRPAASAILDHLEADGLLQRQVNPSDRRQFLISLTAKGLEMAGRIDGNRRERLQVALRRLSHADLETLGAGLRALEDAVAAVELGDEPAALAEAPAR